jgi:hypothetical protein
VLSPPFESRLGSEGADGSTVCEESVQVLAATPAVSSTTVNTAGALSAVEIMGTDGVGASCQR